MHFSDEYIAEIKNKNPLIEVIKDYTVMSQEGKYLKGQCPFHSGDNTPSFTYHPDDQGAHCYGCGINIGDSVDFISKHENLNFPETIEFLAERAGMDLPTQENTQFQKRKEYRDMLQDKSREFWINLMTVDENKKIKDYLYSRGLDDDDINKWRMGYCDFRYVQEFKNNPNNKIAKQFKKFTNRIIFSVLDHRGNIVGFSGRRLPDANKDYAKYLNSSDKDNELFHKNEIVYGLNYAKRTISSLDFAIWVEGFLDVQLMHKAGVENTIASMGTAITKEQIQLVSKFTKNVILFMDPDEAGENAMKNSLELFSSEGMEVKLVQGISGLDPAETVEKFGKNFKNWLYTNAKTIEQYYVDKFLSQYNAKVNLAKSKMIKDLREIFSTRLNNIETEIALGAICSAINVNIDSLKNMIARELKAS
jgi:DNA primase